MTERRTPRISLLSGADCERVHEATLDLMRRVGVRFLPEEALSVFRQAGFEITDGDIVRFQPDDVEAALETVPKSVVRRGLSPGFDVEIGGGTLAMGAGSVPLYVIETPSYERRPATLDDLVKFTWLVDGLENLAIGNGVVLPHDVAGSVMHVIWNLNAAVNTSKPSCCWYATTPQMAEDGMAVMSAAAGGTDNLREMKTWAVSICQEGALTWGPSMYGLLGMAQYDVPIEIVPMPIGGSMCPVTMAGTLVHTNMEAISAIVLSQLLRPGCPIIYAPSYGGSMDMRLAAHCFGTPETALQGAAFAQLGHWYGFPTNMMAGLSDAKVPDEQAAYEKMMVLLLPALSGADCITQAGGLLDFGLSASYEQMVIDDEICSQVLNLVTGFDFDDQALATAAIEQVGHGGSYLMHEHTLRHFREELWMPRISNRETYDQWAEAGSKDVVATAAHRAEEILAEHRPVGITGSAAQAAESVVRSICQREGVDSACVEQVMLAKS